MLIKILDALSLWLMRQHVRSYSQNPYVWLIEAVSPAGGKLCYWSAGPKGYDFSLDGYSPNVVDAVRFVRERDARVVASGLSDGHTTRLVEHRW